MQKNIIILILFSISSMANSSVNKEEMKIKLLNTLKEVKEYKLRKNSKIKKLKGEVARLHKELEKLKTQLSDTNKKLSQTEKILKKQETEIKIETEIVSSVDNRIERAMEEPPPTITFETPKTVEVKEIQPSWVEIVVEDSMDIYQLALKYYNDREGYRNIYTSNQNVIGNNLMIKDGMSLKIPIVDSFEEQPIILNQD